MYAVQRIEWADGASRKVEEREMGDGPYETIKEAHKAARALSWRYPAAPNGNAYTYGPVEKVGNR